jgi:hypothetical protein
MASSGWEPSAAGRKHSPASIKKHPKIMAQVPAFWPIKYLLSLADVGSREESACMLTLSPLLLRFQMTEVIEAGFAPRRRVAKNTKEEK